ncbi:hypothetical protein RIF29_15518 [Crotalaria pallida]|uniref:Inositol monophosphatase n=1 Tax=Crotalaria pallida TaxID=3830 RepID=A0AAN9FFQ9_CROPI
MMQLFYLQCVLFFHSLSSSAVDSQFIELLLICICSLLKRIIGDAASDYLWCIDPLDGTTNFAHGYPSFAVSVGVLYRGNPAAAAVVI